MQETSNSASTILRSICCNSCHLRNMKAKTVWGTFTETCNGSLKRAALKVLLELMVWSSGIQYQTIDRMERRAIRWIPADRPWRTWRFASCLLSFLCRGQTWLQVYECVEASECLFGVNEGLDRGEIWNYLLFCCCLRGSKSETRFEPGMRA